MGFSHRKIHGIDTFFDTIKQHVSSTKSSIESWCTNTFSKKTHTHDDIAFSAAPDYTRTVLLLTIDRVDNKGLPVWKLNVPGYLHAFGMRNDHNQDTMFMLSDNPTKLINKDKIDGGKFLCISGMTSDSDSGGSCGPCFVYPGSNTYFIIAGGHLGYHIAFTPCFGVPHTINTMDYVSTTQYTITQNNSEDMVSGDDKQYIIIPGSATWKSLFNNNWKANFPKIFN